MDSINDVLNAAKQYCHEHTPRRPINIISATSRRSALKINNTITLEIRNAFILSIVSDRYATTLRMPSNRYWL